MPNDYTVSNGFPELHKRQDAERRRGRTRSAGYNQDLKNVLEQKILKQKNIKTKKVTEAKETKDKKKKTSNDE